MGKAPFICPKYFRLISLFFLVPHLPLVGGTLVVGLETLLNSQYIVPYKSSEKWGPHFFKGLEASLFNTMRLGMAGNGREWPGIHFPSLI